MGCLEVTVAVVSLPGGSAATRVQVFPSPPCPVPTVICPGSGGCGLVEGAGGLSRLGAGCRRVNYCASFVLEWWCGCPFLSSWLWTERRGSGRFVSALAVPFRSTHIVYFGSRNPLSAGTATWAATLSATTSRQTKTGIARRPPDQLPASACTSASSQDVGKLHPAIVGCDSLGWVGR